LRHNPEKFRNINFQNLFFSCPKPNLSLFLHKNLWFP